MRLTRFFFLFVFVLSLFPVSVHAQTPTPPAAVRLLLSTMTPQEKVGQLFLVSFEGRDTSPE
jgi:hypothetical protein